MKIAVVGAGAMGSIYGGKLSQNNEVYLVDVNQAYVDFVNNNGLILSEKDTENIYHPKAVSDSSNLPKMDLIILFVKSIFSEVALQNNKNLIGENTYVMTLQNGAGHEDILQKFVPLERIIRGTTEDVGTVLELGKVRRSGDGNTNIGMLVETDSTILNDIKQTFDDAGFNVRIKDNIQQIVWDKLINNASLSATTGVLKCTIGYLNENQYANNMMRALFDEVCAVAKAQGLEVDKELSWEKITAVTINSKDGVTSISTDLQNGKKTEVDTITGAVVRMGHKLGVPVKTQEFVLNTIHAMEGHI
ncbi:2-dehydropantoate 2-reductase [Candidatus Epulonipiscium fishelsonii]|uniref:2-dehydropantoate 2-reductase n=1 Tax=Candidatus Epulonipiscium fishelsonii TaxID=77094 RepID=A0ACC8X817_9FIRM|nr:2-dehydropantoate 2-reductase [Epulopiscium sp. SCG-B11WGA-EpuloA1]ONI40721.1 2-dehydropantoate 2-reductase [Epulopiscium sp. SCG-B05WGA-EpuloA1]ONI47601.1 2-dehydropantoate 2-reductase [Epulopiscium sp. SCG-C06WGA-EpuloA1]